MRYHYGIGYFDAFFWSFLFLSNFCKEKLIGKFFIVNEKTVVVLHNRKVLVFSLLFLIAPILIVDIFSDEQIDLWMETARDYEKQEELIVKWINVFLTAYNREK